MVTGFWKYCKCKKIFTSLIVDTMWYFAAVPVMSVLEKNANLFTYSKVNGHSRIIG